MSIPGIHRLRLAFIWVETTLDLVREPQPAAPFAFLGRDATFVPRFDAIQKGQKDPDGLTLPWLHPLGDHFWGFYMETPPAKANGDRAWKRCVPFRSRLDLSVSAAWLPARVLTEGFCYPYGHALVITFEVEPPAALALTDAVQLAHDVRKRKKLEVTWPDGRSEQLVLDALAAGALDMVRELALGKGAQVGTVASAPFSVVTFVAIEGVDPNAPLPEDGEIHQALEAVTRWHDGPLGPLPPLKDNVLNPAATYDVVYKKKRARAVWSPFPASSPGKHTLSCYGRNLVHAAMQTESLARLAVATLDHGILSVAHQDLAGYAGGLLGRLYGGVDTYRSGSSKAQLEQNDWLDAIDQIRTKAEMAKLVRA